MTPQHPCQVRRSASAYALTVVVAVAATACATINAPDASIDPQAIAFGADVRIDDAQRQALRSSLYESLVAQFSAAGLRVTRTQGQKDDAMAVRATVTRVGLANPLLNSVTTVLLFAPVSRGSMSVEIEGLDGANGQHLAALAFSGKAGIENLGSAFSDLGHAKLQADVAANRFVALVTGVQREPNASAAASDKVQP